MRYLWSRLLVMLLLVEGIIFTFNYTYGPFGLYELQILQTKKNNLLQEINLIQSEIDLLHHQIDEWSSDIFFKEKYAREKLHMQKENEIVYFTPKKDKNV